MAPGAQRLRRTSMVEAPLATGVLDLPCTRSDKEWCVLVMKEWGCTCWDVFAEMYVGLYG